MSLSKNNGISNERVIGSNDVMIEELLITSPSGPDIDSEWSDDKEALRQFIEKFESLPQLWDQKDPLYTNKTARNRGFDELKAIYSKIKPNCSRDNVKRKINTLRCNYRKELKKVINSKTSGNSDSVYKPTSWVFYCLQFLNPFEQPVRYQETNVHKESNADEGTNNVFISCTPEIVEHEGPRDNGTSVASEPSGVINRCVRKRIIKQEKEDILVQSDEEFKKPRIEDDRFDVISKGFAIKLRGVPHYQMLLAERLINDVLFYAETNSLTINHQVVEQPNHKQHILSRPSTSS